MSSTVPVRYVGAIDRVDLPPYRAGIARESAHGFKPGDDVIDVPADVAGREPGEWVKFGEPGLPESEVRSATDARHYLQVDEQGQWWVHDPGEGLLAQPDNWQPVKPTKRQSTATNTGTGA